MRSTETDLRVKIRDKQSIVGIIGLGYVGLPLALAFSEHGFSTIGFDKDREKIQSLKDGLSYVGSVTSDRLQLANSSGKFSFSMDFSKLRSADVIIICVPTPLTPERDPDLSYVIESAEKVSDTLRPGQLVILESTTYPGTTEDILGPVLSATGLICGRDFFLAYSPEREDPGNRYYSILTIPKIVAGVDQASGDLAEQFYAHVVTKTIRVSSAKIGEAAKLTENIFRAVNIALVNELKVVYDAMGIDVWEVLDAADTKPFGFMRFNPGPGWGGHCIPIDPFYLSWRARSFGITPHFIELAGEINREMPNYVTDKVIRALNAKGKSVRGSRILVLGASYKKNIGDIRESPARILIRRLIELGGDVCYHDPFVSSLPADPIRTDLPPLESQNLTPQLLEKVDAVLLLTDHSTVDYSLVSRYARLIIDTRGVFELNNDRVVRS